MLDRRTKQVGYAVADNNNTENMKELVNNVLIVSIININEGCIYCTGHVGWMFTIPTRVKILK